ncbi:MAG: tRNA 2-selenouridine(34) synthase MnmH [Pseudomonadota bacterium]
MRSGSSTRATTAAAEPAGTEPGSHAILDAVLRGERVLIDVRAPVEFSRARVPASVNLPILTDAERKRIGITYKQQGAAAAEKLGYRLVAGSTRAARVAGWAEILKQQPDALLCCWRGGLRSQIACRWLQEAGIAVERLAGGYQALRQRSLQILERWPAQTRLFLLGGRTGVGKTLVLNSLAATIDLEGLASHRGSAFGQVAAEQPTPATFENTLAGASLRTGGGPVLLEDESRTIGRLALPEAWFAAMREAPILHLEASLAERVSLIHRDYIERPLTLGQSEAELFRRYAGALQRIRKRLGGQRHSSILAALQRGFSTNDHAPWIEQLLSDYYDPSYDYQLEKKLQRVILRGSAAEIRDYWRSLTAASVGSDKPPHDD